MFELLTDAPQLLRDGHVVFFDDQWPEGTQKNNKWFEVISQYKVRYEVARNIASGVPIDLSFASVSAGIDNTNLALLPTNTDTLYEILFGFKTSSILVYPFFNSSFLHNLEAENVTPTVTDDQLRYLGFWEPEDSPFEEPRIRDHLVYYQQAPMLRLYNDESDLADRIVFRFIVNRCTLKEIQPPRDQTADRARRPQYLTESRRR